MYVCMYVRTYVYLCVYIYGPFLTIAISVLERYLLLLTSCCAVGEPLHLQVKLSGHMFKSL